MKKILSLCLVLTLCVGMLAGVTVPASAATSGTCGDNLTWTLDNGTLTISGTGAMADYSSSLAPWESDRDSIETVVIEDGVTSIGNWAFSYCYDLTSVTIGDDVLNIEDNAFYWCDSLTSVTIGDSVTSIGNGAFYSCERLTSVTIPDSVLNIGEDAFSWCNSLTSITIGDSVTSIGNGAFYSCTSLTDVYYGGTEEDRDGISIGSYNAPLADATWHYTKKGTCGDNLTWTLDNGTLTISGTGAMTDYSNSSTPWSDDRDSIKTVVIEDGVTSIGGSAFSACRALTSVTIGDDVISIGEYAFSTCYDLTSVTIGDSVTSIGDSAFNWCESLTSVTIPDSVLSIEDDAFYACTSLTSVTIGDSVTSIGEYAFSSCESLTSVTIPDSVLNIGNSAFYYCRALTSVTIGNGVTSIEGDTFYYCTSLTSVTIPYSVTSIGNEAFYSCTSLTDVYYGGSEKDRAGISIGSYNAPLTDATWHCLKKGTCGENLIWILDDNGTLTISGTGAMTDYSSSSLAPWSGDSDSIETVVIEDGVTSIGNSAFSSCWSLTSVTIGDDVLNIGNNAFYWCDSLTSVTIGDSVTNIGNGAFYSCESLTSVTIPDSVLNIGNNAFSYCYDLTSATIGDSVTSIGDSAFSACENLTSVTIPDSVLNIGEGAFQNCTKLTSVTIGNGVSNIGYSAFDSCESLTSVTIGDGVTSIEDSAFDSCDSLTNVYYSGSEEERDGISIGDYNQSFTRATWYYAKDDVKEGTCGVSLTWKLEPNGTLTISGTGEMTNFPSYSSTPWSGDIDSIKTVVIEDGVTSVGDNAFYFCESVTSVTIGDDVLNIGNGAFYGCDITSVTIPNRVLSIGEDAFSWCNSLISVTIPNSVTSIGDSAFFWCRALTSVTIGVGVTSIGYEAFAFCNSLTDVYYVGTEEDRAGISIDLGNEPFTDATWHYNYKLPPAITLSTVNGAQIRTSGAQGLRFTSSIDKTSLDFSRVVEYGTVLIPTADITDISELTIGATLNGHTVAKVPAKYVSAEDDETVTFTAVLINIAEKNYAREYTARSYAIMDDGTVVYADTGASRSIYTVAKLGLENPNESDANKEIFQAIVDIVEE